MSALTTYPKAVAKLVPFVGGGKELPADRLTLDAAEIDRGNITAYQRVCGFPVSDVLPATYPHMLAFPLSMDLMTRLSFPFGVIGLVHVENRIERLRPITADERLDVSVGTEDLRPHPRGRQFDVVATASVEGEVVYRSWSTYLHREKTDGAKDEGKPKRKPRPGPKPTATWRVPGDIGRRYGAVSGDMNPIHLHPLSAKLFGFPRNIAHGMWVKARALAALEGHLPAAYDVAVQFKLPMPVPASVGFSTQVEGDERTFAVADAKSGKPHLSGTVTPR
jgi:acyl dehydratase